jgi:glycerophosphoryl diester phosphodiesterase
MAAVLEVPKSIPSTRMEATLTLREPAAHTRSGAVHPPVGRAVHTRAVRYAFLAGAAPGEAPPLAFAHRGGAAAGDENTVAAFQRAVDLGYRYLETDTQATADGVAMVFHDATLTRILGRADKLARLRYADLASIRSGGEPVVPRLDDLLTAWPHVRFNVDVKADTVVGPAIEVVRRTGTLERVLIASFSDRRLARVRAVLGPRLATSLGPRAVAGLLAASRVGRGGRRAVAGAAAAQVPMGAGPLRVVDRRFVAHAHALGLHVHVWTIDEPGPMNHLLDLGVDGIMTDHVDVLHDVYARRGLWPG